MFLRVLEAAARAHHAAQAVSQQLRIAVRALAFNGLALFAVVRSRRGLGLRNGLPWVRIEAGKSPGTV
jgi:hypothetical protein